MVLMVYFISVHQPEFVNFSANAATIVDAASNICSRTKNYVFPGSELGLLGISFCLVNSAHVFHLCRPSPPVFNLLPQACWLTLCLFKMSPFCPDFGTSVS